MGETLPVGADPRASPRMQRSRNVPARGSLRVPGGCLSVPLSDALRSGGNPRRARSDEPTPAYSRPSPTTVLATGGDGVRHRVRLVLLPCAAGTSCNVWANLPLIRCRGSGSPPRGRAPVRGRRDAHALMSDFEMSGGPSELTESERRDFARLDRRVRQLTRDRDLTLGRALRPVRERRLFRASFGSWAAYCAARLEHGKRQADRLIAYADLRDRWDPGVPFPETERQGRPLTGLNQPELRAAVARIEAAGGFAGLSVREVERLAREAPESAEAEGRSAALVQTKTGPLTLAQSRVLRHVEAMHAAALAISRLGPHAIPDAVAALTSPEEVE